MMRVYQHLRNPLSHTIAAGIILISFLKSCERFPEIAQQVDTIRFEYSAKDNKYILTGYLFDFGEEAVVQHGFCISNSPNPTIDGTKTELGGLDKKGFFHDYYSDFEYNTTYYFRSYAISDEDITYGDDISFQTVTPGLPISDIDGNNYTTVHIGDQIWMAENLKTTRYASGVIIPYADTDTEWPYNGKAYSWYDYDSGNKDIYGALYTWEAAMDLENRRNFVSEGVQGVCPDGWHLPSDDDWNELELFLDASIHDADYYGWFGKTVGGKLKSVDTLLWKGNNVKATDEVGFTALPGGYKGNEYDQGEWLEGFFGKGESAYFWTSSEYEFSSYGSPLHRHLDTEHGEIYRGEGGDGYSVRCIKDL